MAKFTVAEGEKKGRTQERGESASVAAWNYGHISMGGDITRVCIRTRWR